MENYKITQASSEDKITEYYSSELSANALFNFMREYQYLEDTINRMAFLPRYYPENIEYLDLKNETGLLNEWYIPMTCFCDIPLHQISYHAEGKKQTGYGKFSIALHKKFGIKNGIQPIQYLNSRSIQTKELRNAIQRLMSDNSPAYQDEIYSSLSNYLFEFMMRIKPLDGTMKRWDNKEGKYLEIGKNFHDEHEWRYIPELEVGELPLLLYKQDDIIAESSSQYYTNSIVESKKGLLKFEVSDIRYIFVDTISSRERLIKFIKGKRKGKRISKTEKDILISKILVYDEIKEDW